MNYYEIPTQNKHYNPIVETMNNNYQNLYQNFDAENFYALNQKQNLTNQNSNQTDSQNLNNQNNTQNQQNTENQNSQNMSDKTGLNNNSNMNNIANMLNSFGGNNNYMDMIKTIAGGGNGIDKNQMILNLLSNMNNKTATQNKKTTAQNSDFLNLTSIDDYNFID